MVLGCPCVHQNVRFWAESDHSFWSYLPLSDENFTLLNLISLMPVGQSGSNFMCSIIGVIALIAEKTTFDLGTLDSGERLLPFVVFLVRVISLSGVMPLEKIRMKSDARQILWTVHARVLKFHIWIPHGKIADPYFFSSSSYLPFWSYAPLKKSEWHLVSKISRKLFELVARNLVSWLSMMSRLPD